MTTPHTPIQLHIDIDNNDLSVAELLTSKIDLSKQQIKQVMQKGAVWLTPGKNTQRRRRATKVLQQGDVLHFYYDKKVLDEVIAGAELIKDENDFSVWYKPYGMRSQGSKWGDHTTIYRYAEQHLQPQRPAFIVHRLDRAASGLIILAHKKQVTRDLCHMFKERAIDKNYQVIVHGLFPSSTQHIQQTIDGKHASSFASLVKYDSEKNRSLLEVKIETGRKHQIRRHLSEQGYPVVGDRLYGTMQDSENLQLTAYKLSFVSPVDGQKKEYTLTDEMKLCL